MFLPVKKEKVESFIPIRKEKREFFSPHQNREKENVFFLHHERKRRICYLHHEEKNVSRRKEGNKEIFFSPACNTCIENDVVTRKYLNPCRDSNPSVSHNASLDVAC